MAMMTGRKFKEALEPKLFEWFLPGRNNWLWGQLKLCAADRTAQKLQDQASAVFLLSSLPTATSSMNSCSLSTL